MLLFAEGAVKKGVNKLTHVLALTEGAVGKLRKVLAFAEGVVKIGLARLKTVGNLANTFLTDPSAIANTFLSF